MIVLFLIIHIFHVIYVLNTNIVYIKKHVHVKRRAFSSIY